MWSANNQMTTGLENAVDLLHDAGGRWQMFQHVRTVYKIESIGLDRPGEVEQVVVDIELQVGRHSLAPTTIDPDRARELAAAAANVENPLILVVLEQSIAATVNVGE